ncbi:DUF805 domain-containing protein [Candidatus Sororendozoicomonas aggregata]|uniref:DUF805 domain-containing protein n=1 Tax=Candidatus Sororendozoicomonas aggregata TaxID=3073239 RepID=UPI002ED3DB23
MNDFFDALKQYAVFRGRTRRRGYWLFHLVYFVLFGLMTVMDNLLGTPFFVYLMAAALTIPSLAVSTRRLHDSGRSGWWQLISLIPFVGFVILIYFFVQPSDNDNAYGLSPLTSS